MLLDHSQGLQGIGVISFESRMAGEMADLIRHSGGTAISAPSMQEVPLAANHHVFTFAEQLFAGKVQMILFMTGVGTTILIEALTTRYPLGQLVAALSRLTVVARGPKPIRVLKEYGLPITVSVPYPSTWREIVQTLDMSPNSLNYGGQTIAIQEYGASNLSLIQALTKRGAHVLPVPVYRWAPPDDTSALEHGIQSVIAGTIEIALFTNSEQIRHILQYSSSIEKEELFRNAMRRLVIASIGPTTTEALIEAGFQVDFEPTRPEMDILLMELAPEAHSLIQQKKEPPIRSIRFPSSGQMQDPHVLRADSIFLRACRRESTPVTPVWLLRQAGRYMKEYQDIRSKVPFLELCKNKELIAEVTITAAEKLKTDAAILFSDILLVVEPMGLDLEYRAEGGPVISGEMTTGKQIDALNEIDPDLLQFVFDGVKLTREGLNPRCPLIGFCGAPFTVASYIIEGGSSREFFQTKKLMYSDPGAWHALMQKISRGLIKFLNGQIAAGADAVQLFDSWVGCCGTHDYQEFVLPHTRAVIQGITPGVPILHFGTGTSHFLGQMRQAGGDVIGVDFRMELDAAWEKIGRDVGIQGNLDPVVLCSSRATIRTCVKRILDQASGRPGHIFNVGHGVLPMTPVDNAVALVEFVHELSQRR